MSTARGWRLDMCRVAHWSLDYNPGMTKSTGRIVEDERVFGCVEFGVGAKGTWIGGAPWGGTSAQ